MEMKLFFCVCGVALVEVAIWKKCIYNKRIKIYINCDDLF